MRFLRRALTGLFLAALTLALLIFAARSVFDAVESRMARGGGMPPARERVFAVNVIEAEAQRATPQLRAFGEVRSRRTLELRASAPGTVVELAEAFEDGGAVTEGQVLVRIDPAEAEAALARARTDLMDAEAEAREAARAVTLAEDELAAAEDQAALREKAFQRQADLAERGVGTAAAVETAELAASAARATVLSRRQAVAQAQARVDQAATRRARAELAVQEAQRQLGDRVIRAGFDGLLSEVSVVEGGLVSQGERLARLVDANALEVAFRVSTAQYARLLDAEGALQPLPVTARLDVMGADLTAEGRITRAGAAVAEGQTGRLIFAALGRAPGFKPGDFVTISVAEPELAEVVELPAAALGADGAVLALGPDDRLEALPATLLRRQGDRVLLAAEGLAGRRIVARRTPLLGAGIKVRPLEGPQAQLGAAAAPGAPGQAALAGQGQAAGAEDMLELTEDRRARLVAFVEGSDRLPAEAKQRLLAQLAQPRVPARMVARIEARMGG